MRAIRALVPNIDLAGIAAQLRSMKRLWDPDKLPGLIARREAEAVLVEQAMRSYLPDELVRI
jgi:GH24 family phage-related lysozyme (muramidase)